MLVRFLRKIIEKIDSLKVREIDSDKHLHIHLYHIYRLIDYKIDTLTERQIDTKIDKQRDR